MGLFNKKELARIAELERENEILKATLSKTKGLSVAQEEKYLQRLKEQNQEERKAIMELKDEITALESKKASIQNDLDEINLEVDFAEVGLYKPPYSSYSSEKYKAKLEANRSHQKNMVKNGTAVTGNMEWTVNGNLKAGRKMVNDNIKMVLRAFNNECTVIVGKVRFGNLEKAVNQVVKLVGQIEKLNTTHDIKISKKYIQLKLEELERVSPVIFLQNATSLMPRIAARAFWEPTFSTIRPFSFLYSNAMSITSLPEHTLSITSLTP